MPEAVQRTFGQALHKAMPSDAGKVATQSYSRLFPVQLYARLVHVTEPTCLTYVVSNTCYLLLGNYRENIRNLILIWLLVFLRLLHGVCCSI